MGGRPQSPVLVRRDPIAPPVFHSHSLRRRIPQLTSPGTRKIRLLRTVIFLLGLCASGFYGYTVANVHVYQAYQNWAFDQQIAGHRVTFADYVRTETPLGFLVGQNGNQSVSTINFSSPSANRMAAPRLPVGSLLGRISIARLNLSAIVREGADADTLSRAVGHVPSTALAGYPGNFAIAAHRDTLFRGLKDIRDGDLVTFESPSATYIYQVFSTKIVKPSDLSVLRPNGGLTNSSVSKTGTNKLLTMITCYPFYFVGAAPKRFIVQARLISNPGLHDPKPLQGVQVSAPPGGPSPPRALPRRTTPIDRTSLLKPRSQRGFSQISPSSTNRSALQQAHAKPTKHGFWHKLLHLS